MATDTMTWHDYLSNIALENWMQTKTLCDEAEKNGYVLSDADQAYLDDSMASLATYAEKAGHAAPEGYLYQLFDPCADMDSYYDYNWDSVYASCYANDRYQAFYDDVYDPNAAVQYCVNVRHILLQPGEGEDMSAALTQAEALYEEWKQNPTEDNFAALAGEHTTDPGSQSNGGLYEDVYPGQMVTNFNDWCFDESRQPGDHGIVETEYGYHIMYFVGNSETVYSDANDTAAQEQYTLWLDDLFAGAQYVPQLQNAVFTQKAQ
jgi:parvulin-like peptidyl-prolyl isomerase